MAWPRLDYVGVDLLPSMVEDNLAALLTRSPSRFGLRLTEFRQADMPEDRLPEADLLLSKYVHAHPLPENADIGRLLRRLTACPARSRGVFFVLDQVTPDEVAWRRQRPWAETYVAKHRPSLAYPRSLQYVGGHCLSCLASRWWSYCVCTERSIRGIDRGTGSPGDRERHAGPRHQRSPTRDTVNSPLHRGTGCSRLTELV